MNPLGSLRKLFNLLLESTRELCMRIILGICLFFGYVVLSMIIYVTMRHFLVPQKTHILPVHLMFSPSCNSDTIDQHYKDKQFVRPLDYETPGYSSFQKCMYPYAEFYLAEGQRLLSPGHVYSVAVELDLPENQNNENIGMFMVNLTFYSYSGTPSISSIRPTILRYKSFLLRTMSTIFYSLPLILGLTEEKQRQVIIMLDNYQEPYTEATVFARVTLLSNRVQVYSVELTLDAVFTGLSYYLYHWPISMTVIIVSGIFFTLSILTLLMWARQFLEKLDQFRRRRRHSSLRMTIRPSELDPIPEEDERRRTMDNHSVEDVSVTDHSRTDSMETGSTISSVTEVTNTSDISELDNSLLNLRERLDVEDNEPENSAPLITESDDSKDEYELRHRKS